MKNIWAVAFGVVCGLLGAGLLYSLTRPPRGEVIRLLPPPVPAPLVVHVSGAVVNPGVYSLPSGSRLGDAVQAAGGMTEAADKGALNLAAPLQDGERIDIPIISIEPQTTSPSEQAILPATITPVDEAIHYPIDINRATQAELESLPGIGPVLAKDIIIYLETHGPFRTIEEIQDVSGIGPAKFEKIKTLIIVGEVP